MANDQKDQRFDENRPGQEKNQGTAAGSSAANQPGQNPGMKKDDLNRPSDADRGLNRQGQGSQQPYGERSSTGMSDKDRDLNSPSSEDRGVNPSGTYTPGRDIDREGPSEPYGRERSSGTSAQGEPRREEQRQDDDDEELTEIPSREEERKIKTPSGEENNPDPSSEKDDLNNPQTGKTGAKGESNWGAE